MEAGDETRILQRLEQLYAQLGELRYRSKAQRKSKSSSALSPEDEETEPSKGRLIIAYKELPCIEDKAKPFGLPSILAFNDFTKQKRMHWVGIGSENTAESEKNFTEKLQGKNFRGARTGIKTRDEGHVGTKTVIRVERKLKELFHEGYCKKVLWPLFHSLPPTSEYLIQTHDSENPNKISVERMWEAYVMVNQKFADAVCETYEEGDIIWIHGYHLMLLPSMLRALLPSAPIGFFFHLPFPSTEFYRILNNRDEILLGLLGSTLVAFQTFDYTRHFLSACTRVLGLETSPKGVSANGHFTGVTTCPIGINTEPIIDILKTPGLIERVHDLRKQFRNRVVLLGYDSVRVHSGLIHKLLAFEEMLRLKPDWRDKVILIQVCTVGHDSDPDLLSGLHRLVARINGRNATVSARSGGPVYLIEKYFREDVTAVPTTKIKSSLLMSDLNLSAQNELANMSGLFASENRSILLSSIGEIDLSRSRTRNPRNTSTKTLRADTDQDLCSIMAVADVYIATETRSGMNLAPFYYTVCRSVFHATSTLILSEFVGAAHSLGGGALLVNPWDTNGVAKAMSDAISLPLKERKVWHNHLSNHVYKHTASKWMNSLVSQVETAHAESVQQTCLQRLETHELLHAYRATKTRMLTFDYEGTIVAGQGFSELVAPKEEILDILKLLCMKEENRVILVSHRQKHILDQWFRSIPNLILCAESGAFIRWRHNEEWIATHDASKSNQQLYGKNPVYSDHSDLGSAEDEMTGNDWRSEILPLFEYYRERTPGSTIEVADTTMAWYYHDADANHGPWQASTLMQSLREFCNRLPILVTSEKNTVRVRLPTVSKATMLMYLLQRFVMEKGNPDFIWIMSSGEDRSDNDMFSLLEPKSERPRDEMPVLGKAYYAINHVIHKSRGENAAEKIKEKIKRNSLPMRLPWHLYRCVVGQKASTAKLFVPSIGELISMLVELSQDERMLRDPIEPAL